MGGKITLNLVEKIAKFETPKDVERVNGLLRDANKELIALTPKDNIKESKGTKGYHDVDKYYQD